MNKAIRLAVIVLLALTAAAPKSRAEVKEYLFVETYLQLAPAAFHLTSEYFGIESTHSLAHKAIASASSFAIQTAVCYVIKHSFKEMRPDGSSRNSFPSAHTAAAFTGAELIRRDLGWGYGGLAYACGVGVAAGRVIHKRHWWWDTAVGAGIGIISAGLGCKIAEAIDIDSKLAKRVSFAPAYDPQSGAYMASLTLAF